MKSIYAVCCGPFAEYLFICGDSTEIIYFKFATQRKSFRDRLFTDNR